MGEIQKEHLENTSVVNPSGHIGVEDFGSHIDRQPGEKKVEIHEDVFTRDFDIGTVTQSKALMKLLEDDAGKLYASSTLDQKSRLCQSSVKYFKIWEIRNLSHEELIVQGTYQIRNLSRK